MTGTWRVKVHTDPKAAPIAQAAFLVEDFVPERLELKLEAAAQALSPRPAGRRQGRGALSLRSAGRRPRASRASIAVRASPKDVAGFPGFKFGLADEQISPVRKPLDKLPATSADGKAEIAVELPALREDQPPAGGRCHRQAEGIGRAHHRAHGDAAHRHEARAHRHQAAVQGPGRRRRDRRLRGHRRRRGRQGRRRPRASSGQLLRLERRWQWYSRDGSWAFEPTTRTRRVASGTVDAAPGAPAKIEARLDWGRYRLEVSDGSGLVSSVVFNAGYWADESADSPETLDVALDKHEPTGPATPRASRSARAWRAARSSPCSQRPARHPGGGPARRRRRGADQGRRGLEPWRLRGRHALPPPGREGQAHAGPGARPALARHRPGAAHDRRQPRRPREGRVRQAC